MAERVTRLAPSPTGALHLGNVRTFLLNWAAARQGGWRIIMRIEDLDGPRIKPEAAAQALDVLAWLGMDWDGEPIYQSHDLSPYDEAMQTLSRKRLIYRCPATRREIEAAASAPHADEHELRYPGLYRPAHDPPSIPAGAQTATRVIVPDGPIKFVDEAHGPQAVDVQQQVGDFVVHTKADLPAYQLAVVVDDARQGVTDIIRGDDLLRSTARQVLLYDYLELGPPPRYRHVPLIYGPDGRRLAKRHGDTRVVTYRDHHGTPSEKIIGLMAQWCGLVNTPTPMTADGFLKLYAWDKLSPDPITLTPEDDAWLKAN